MAWCSKGPRIDPANYTICSVHLHVQMALRGYCFVNGEANDQSMELTVSDAIARSRLQLGAARWATSVALLQVVDN